MALSKFKKTDFVIFRGNGTIESVKLRTNRDGLIEYREKFKLFGGWQTLNYEAIPPELISEELVLNKGFAPTRWRVVIIDQSLKGIKNPHNLNPRLIAEYNALKTELESKTLLCRALRDNMISLVGKDKFERMMKDFMRVSREVRQEGMTISDFKFGGGSYYQQQPKIED